MAYMLKDDLRYILNTRQPLICEHCDGHAFGVMIDPDDYADMIFVCLQCGHTSEDD